jgi:hypothetical protein
MAAKLKIAGRPEKTIETEFAFICSLIFSDRYSQWQISVLFLYLFFLRNQFWFGRASN